MFLQPAVDMRYGQDGVHVEGFRTTEMLAALSHPVLWAFDSKRHAVKELVVETLAHHLQISHFCRQAGSDGFQYNIIGKSDT